MWWLLGGILIAGIIFFIWALCAIGARADERIEEMLRKDRHDRRDV